MTQDRPFALDTPSIGRAQYEMYRTIGESSATHCSAMAQSVHIREKSIKRPQTPLARAREAAGYKDAAEFARRHDLPESTYRSHENGIRGLTVPTAKQYAKLLGVSWQSLIEGNENAVESSNVLIPKPQAAGVERELDLSQMARDVPVRGIASCGQDGLFEFMNTGDPIDFVKRPARLVGIRDSYALYVQGDSMAPWRENGEPVYVHPGQTPKIGDYVVAQVRPKRPGDPPTAYIKRLVRVSGDKVILQQYNPEKELTFRRQDVTLHRILNWGELLGL